MDGFLLDYGDETGHEYDAAIHRYRSELEFLLGKDGAGVQNGGGKAKDVQDWGNPVRPGTIASTFTGSGHGITSPGSFASPYPMSPHGVIPLYGPQQPVQSPPGGGYVGHNASYFGAPVAPGFPQQVHPSVLMEAGHAAQPGNPYLTNTPPTLVRTQTAPSGSGAWLERRAEAGADVAGAAGRIV